MTAFSSCKGVPDSLLWSPDDTPKDSPICATIESQSSICGTAGNYRVYIYVYIHIYCDAKLYSFACHSPKCVLHWYVVDSS